MDSTYGIVGKGKNFHYIMNFTGNIGRILRIGSSYSLQKLNLARLIP